MIVVVDVSPDAFQKALERYVDENKPERHVRQQLESWKMEWEPSSSNTSSSASTSSITSDFTFEPTHILAGNLLWQGDYMKLKLSVQCNWKGSRKDGSIHFSCHVVQAELTQAPNHLESSLSEKDAKAAIRVHKKIIQRLKMDDYVGKLTQGNQSLIEATVAISESGNLEERVYCDETMAEAIRRCLYTTGENSLDVFEWIVSLPFLPSSAHQSAMSVTTGLADRVKLRCLEEAAYDACEQEEEEEIVEDLHISKKSKKNGA